MISPSEETIFLSFSDLKRLFIRHAPRIQKAALFCALALLIFLFFQEPKYKATASFRQASGKNIPEQAFKSLLKNMLFQESEPNAMSAMQSRRLMRSVVQEMGLQAEVAYPSLFSRSFGRIGRSIAAELRLFLPEREEFAFKDLAFDGERPQHYYIRLVSSDSLELLNEKKEVVGLGRRGEKMHAGSLSLIVEKIPEGAKAQKLYSLTIKPWPKIARRLLSDLQIKVDRRDKNLLHLTFLHRDRHQSAAFLNHLMASYQKHLKKENEEIARDQLDYLQQRQEELTKKFDHDLLDQVAYMKKNLGEGGFIGLRQEIEMLSLPEEEYRLRLQDLDLQRRRYETKAPMRLARAKKSEEESDERQQRATAAQQYPVASYEAEHSLLQHELLKLEKEEQHHLLRGVKEEQPLTHLDLESAQKLYADYMQQLDALQATIEQLRFFSHEMQRPDFELSSLTSVLSDPVSQEMVRKASQYALELQDENNRSGKDQERLKESLETQRRFIREHITQTAELYRVRAQLFQEKIASLENTSLFLIREERQLLQEKLQELKGRMALLPDKWRLEHQLKFKTDLSMGIMEGMAQLVESKNINQHLYQVESRTLDFAIAPVKAQPSGLVALPLLAALLGGASLFGFHLFQGLRRGLPLSREFLQAQGRHVSGTLSPYCEQPLARTSRRDLETLRTAADFVSKRKCAALLEGGNGSISRSLAELLAMRDLKLLLLHCSFDEAAAASDAPGLWQFLNGEVPMLPVRRMSGYDEVPAGAAFRHGAELLGSKRWSQLLSELAPSYDLILLSSRARLSETEARILLTSADHSLAILSEEKIDDLRPYLSNPNITFLLKS